MCWYHSVIYAQEQVGRIVRVHNSFNQFDMSAFSYMLLVLFILCVQYPVSVLIMYMVVSKHVVTHS